MEQLKNLLPAVVQNLGQDLEAQKHREPEHVPGNVARGARALQHRKEQKPIGDTFLSEVAMALALRVRALSSETGFQIIMTEDAGIDVWAESLIAMYPKLRIGDFSLFLSARFILEHKITLYAKITLLNVLDLARIFQENVIADMSAHKRQTQPAEEPETETRIPLSEQWQNERGRQKALEHFREWNEDPEQAMKNPVWVFSIPEVLDYYGKNNMFELSHLVECYAEAVTQISEGARLTTQHRFVWNGGRYVREQVEADRRAFKVDFETMTVKDQANVVIFARVELIKRLYNHFKHHPNTEGLPA